MSTNQGGRARGVDNALPTLESPGWCIEPTRGEGSTLRGYDDAERCVLSVFGLQRQRVQLADEPLYGVLEVEPL